MLASHQSITFVNLFEITGSAGGLDLYSLSCSIDCARSRSFSRTDVVHASRTGSCGPRAGRIPARDAAWAGPGYATRRPRRPGWEPVITRPDPMTEEEREAWLDALAGEDEPFDPEEYPDPEGAAAAGSGRADARGDRRDRRGYRGGSSGRCERGAVGYDGSAGRDRGAGRAARPGAARVGAPGPGRVLQPGGCVRQRAGAGCDAGLPGPGAARRSGGRGRRPV